ncbi:hypothetical protein N9C84_02110 [Desulfobacterales bacterium]|nr:hypothetical protein [Desulfobacterales bacterium]
MGFMLENFSDIIEIAFFLMFYSTVHGWVMEIGFKRLEKQRTSMTKKSNFYTRRILPLFDSPYYTREALILAILVAPVPFIYLKDSMMTYCK